MYPWLPVGWGMHDRCTAGNSIVSREGSRGCLAPRSRACIEDPDLYVEIAIARRYPCPIGSHFISSTVRVRQAVRGFDICSTSDPGRTSKGWTARYALITALAIHPMWSILLAAGRLIKEAGSMRLEDSVLLCLRPSDVSHCVSTRAAHVRFNVSTRCLGLRLLLLDCGLHLWLGFPEWIAFGAAQ